MDVESEIHRHGIRNPQRGIRNPRLSWITLHGAIKSPLDSCFINNFYLVAGINARDLLPKWTYNQSLTTVNA